MGSAICCVELTIIELSLKAVLAMEGYSEDQLKDKNMGHNLVPIYEAVSEEAVEEAVEEAEETEKKIDEVYNEYQRLIKI